MREAHWLTGPLFSLVLIVPGIALPAHAAEGKTSAPATAKKKAAAPAPKKQSAPAAAAKASPTPSKAAPAPKAKAVTANGALPAVIPSEPQRGQGTRKLELPKAKAAPTPAPKAQAAAPRGKAPKRPSPTLPPGTPQKPSDMVTRRIIAGGPTADDLRAKKSDPELSTIREAERVLFPHALTGATPGWSWGLPEQPDEGPEVLSSGLPPTAVAPLDRGPSTKDAEWLRGLALPNLPVRYDERVIKYLKFFRDSQSGRAVARAWAKKSGRFVGALKAELSQAGLPTDLVWLSLIESGHNPTISSPAGAAGLWQFMPETARTYGLTVDRWVDQRLDPMESTQAAVRLLSDLYRRFGAWELAMAAYNMGHGGLSRAIRKYNTNDFWELARHEAGIPWETTLYVPKILATAIMMTNKKAFGLDDIEPDPAEAFEVIEVAPGTALSDVARATGVAAEVIERQNAMYLAGRVPPVAPGRASPSCAVHVPVGTASVAGKLFEGGARDDLSSYVARQGDTPASVARQTGASEATVRSLNRLGSQESLTAGTVLLVPRRPTGAAFDDDDEPRGDDPVVVVREVTPPPDTVRVFYPVVNGDTLASVATAFGVARSDLIAWNALDSAAFLQDGMVLQVFPQRSRDLRRLHVLDEKDQKTLLAGSPEFFDYFEGLNGKRRMLVKVKKGDTLASIGRRFETSVGSMERINRRSRSDALATGDTVVVYADRRRYPAPKAPPPTRTASRDEASTGGGGAIAADRLPAGRSAVVE